jgi:hypothetical protein
VLILLCCTTHLLLCQGQLVRPGGAKPQQTIKAKRGPAAPRNKGRKVAHLAHEREDPMEVVLPAWLYETSASAMI